MIQDNMECSSLDHIFNQIIESERMVEKERMILLQVRSDIEQCEKLIKTKNEANLSLEKQISALCQQFCEEKVKSDYLHNKECILAEKKKMLQQRRDTYLNEKEAMKEQLHSNRIAFCDEVDTFMTTFGPQLLQPDDHSSYNMEMQLMNLNQEEKQLTKVINDFNKSQVDASEYQQKKQQIYLKFEEQQQQLKELYGIIEQNIQQLQLAKEENEKVSLKPSTDPEFQSIRQQINLCQQNNVETEQQCAERQIELKQMQKWKKQQQSQTNYGHKE